MNSRFGTALVACLLVLSLPMSVGAIDLATESAVADDAATEPSAAISEYGTAETVATPQASDILHQTTILRHLPDRPGEFETELTFQLPDAVAQFEIDLEAAATVESTDGFEQTGSGTYRWTETTDEPTVRFTMPADRTGSGEHHEHTDSGYTFVDTGDWAVVQVPGVGLSYSRTAPIGIEETVSVDGPGAASDDIAYFGPVTEYERASERETIRLAVADDAALEESPDDILDTLVDASDRLDVGASHDELFVVAVPSDIEWAARGVQYGAADAWVVADAPLEEASNVWLHEYVHARQAFANPDIGTTTETEWLVEAQAEYYATLLALDQGLIEFSTFASALEAGEVTPYTDGVLADPSTWTADRTDYVKGPLVYGELDRQLRLATDGDRSTQDVFRSLNRAEGPVTETDVLDAIETEGGADLRSAAAEYTTTDRTPEMWSRTAHEDAFEGPIAQFAYGFDGRPINVGGEPWEHGGAAAADAIDEIAVPDGEELTIPVSAATVGDRDGTADVTLAVDGAVVDHRQLDLASGDRTTGALTWTPPTPGVYDLRVGSDRLTVYVRSAASVSVTDLQVEPDGPEPGDALTATATVEAVDDRPGATVLVIETPDGTVENVPIVVSPGTEETVTATVMVADTGAVEVAIGGQSTVVSIGAGPLDRLEEMPGFAAGSALVAIAVVVLASRFRT